MLRFVTLDVLRFGGFPVAVFGEPNGALVGHDHRGVTHGPTLAVSARAYHPDAAGTTTEIVYTRKLVFLRWLVLASLVAPLAASCGGASETSLATGGTSGSGGSGGDAWILATPIDEIRSFGDRGFLLYVPSGIDLNRPTPLLLSFHDSAPSESGAAASHARMTASREHAQEHGYIVTYPEGTVRDGRQGWDADVASADLAFVDEVLDVVDAEFGVDPKRVFAAGMGDGAVLAYALACTRGDLFAAIGPVAGGLPADCPLTRRVPAVAFYGTDDEGFDRGRTSVIAWSRRNGCARSTEEVFGRGDSTCEAWLDCQDAADVQFCVTAGAGHTWPGSTAAVRPAAGEPMQELSATDYMWRFFETHPLP